MYDIVSGSGEDVDGETPEVQTPIKTPPKSPMRQTSRTRARQRTTSTSSAPQGPVVRSGARTIYTAGRPPWYDSHGQLKEAFVIGMFHLCVSLFFVKKTKIFKLNLPNPIESEIYFNRNMWWKCLWENNCGKKHHTSSWCTMGFITQYGFFLQGRRSF